MISDEPQSSETKERTEKSGPVIQEYFDEDSIDNYLTCENAATETTVPEEIDEEDPEDFDNDVPAYNVDVSRVIEERLEDESPKATSVSTENDDNLKLLPVHISKKPKLSLNTQLPDLSTQSLDVDLNLLNTPVVESPSKQDKTLTWYGTKQEDFLTDTIPEDLLANPFVDTEAGSSSAAPAEGQWTTADSNLALAKYSRKTNPQDIYNLNTP